MNLTKNQFKIPVLLLTWKKKEIKLILNILKKSMQSIFMLIQMV